MLLSIDIDCCGIKSNKKKSKNPLDSNSNESNCKENHLHKKNNGHEEKHGHHHHHHNRK